MWFWFHLQNSSKWKDEQFMRKLWILSTRSDQKIGIWQINGCLLPRTTVLLTTCGIKPFRRNHSQKHAWNEEQTHQFWEKTDQQHSQRSSEKDAEIETIGKNRIWVKHRYFQTLIFQRKWRFSPENSERISPSEKFEICWTTKLKLKEVARCKRTFHIFKENRIQLSKTILRCHLKCRSQVLIKLIFMIFFRQYRIKIIHSLVYCCYWYFALSLLSSFNHYSWVLI